MGASSERGWSNHWPTKLLDLRAADSVKPVWHALSASAKGVASVSRWPPFEIDATLPIATPFLASGRATQLSQQPQSRASPLDPYHGWYAPSAARQAGWHAGGPPRLDGCTRRAWIGKETCAPSPP